MAARVQAVHVPTLRHTAAVLAGRRQHVPLDQHDMVEPLGQHTAAIRAELGFPPAGT